MSRLSYQVANALATTSDGPRREPVTARGYTQYGTRTKQPPHRKGLLFRAEVKGPIRRPLFILGHRDTGCAYVREQQIAPISIGAERQLSRLRTGPKQMNGRFQKARAAIPVVDPKRPTASRSSPASTRRKPSRRLPTSPRRARQALAFRQPLPCSTAPMASHRSSHLRHQFRRL